MGLGPDNSERVHVDGNHQGCLARWPTTAHVHEGRNTDGVQGAAGHAVGLLWSNTALCGDQPAQEALCQRGVLLTRKLTSCVQMAVV